VTRRVVRGMHFATLGEVCSHEESVERPALRAARFHPQPGVHGGRTAVAGAGIGANTAIFSLLDRVLLRDLPVRAPGELVDITSSGPHTGDVLANFDSDYSFSYPMYRDFRDRAPVFAGVVAWYDVPASLSIGGQTERIGTIMVSGNFFDVLGVRTALGRTIQPEDARVRGAGPVVVLSHGFWVRRFGADPSILNQKVVINGNPMTVIGVAAKGFQGLSVGGAPDLFVPLTMEAEMLPGRMNWSTGAAPG